MTNTNILIAPDEEPVIAPALNGHRAKVDLASLRVDQGHDELITEDLPQRIVMRKPKNGNEYFRVHPDPQYRAVLYLVKHHTDELFIITRDLAALVGDKAKKYTLFTCVNSFQTAFLTYVARPDETGQLHPSALVKHQACARAMQEWVCLTWQAKQRVHKITPGKFTIEPHFPTQSFDEIFNEVMLEQGIVDESHPIIQFALGNTPD